MGRYYWDFVYNINAELGSLMSYKRCGIYGDGDIAILNKIGEEKLNDIIKRLIDFGFDVRRVDFSETHRLFLTVRK
ncbi:hypothetical protein ABE137_12045 [Brevibacillus laterosporus]|uniref:hypothetical protein n=1 Tax=Brevibacillus phage Sundance TaxID=1691958 RepID=UPI0006BC22BF|nr:hypothetical protein AVT09_gp077 [Brevibacillus phage Sundance]ALA47893.1 hypothetical protein SUNDANCE_77 [Brevibacillus phage Sundance]